MIKRFSIREKLIEGKRPADRLGGYLVRGLSAVFLINLVGKGLAFLTSIALARLMGPSNLGVYAMALAVAQLLRMSSALGLPGVVVRYVSAYDADERWGLLRGLLLRALQVTCGLSVVFALVGAWVTWLLQDQLGHDKTTALWFALAMVPLLDLAGLRSAALQGLRRVVFAQVPDGIMRPVLFLFLLGGVWTLGTIGVLTPIVALELQFVAVGAAFLIGSALLFRAIPRPVWCAVPKSDFPRWRSTLLPFMFVHAIQLVLNQVDIIMLSILSTDAAVGLYKIAWQGAELVGFTLGIVNAVIQPMISRLHTQGDRERLQRMVTYTARFAVGIALPVALLLVVAGPWLIGFIFGAGYSASYHPMVLLVVGQLANVLTGSVGMLLLMTGHERDNAVGVSVAAILNIVLDAALIPFLGMQGAAAASAVSLMVWNLFLLRRVRLRLGIEPTAMGNSAAAT